MPDNVYSGNPGLNGLIPKQDDDPPMTLGEAYKLGASVERDNLSESIDEYLELGTQEHDLRSLYSFLEWHLGEGS